MKCNVIYIIMHSLNMLTDLIKKHQEEEVSLLLTLFLV